MTGPTDTDTTNKVELPVIGMDVSRLVGRRIRIFSEQLPGKEIDTKVIAAQDGQIEVESGGNFSEVDNLVNNQKVILQFPYKGQDISVKAMIKRSLGGRCSFTMDEKATPLAQRRFRRFLFNYPVKLAPFPVVTFSRRSLSGLRWIETDSVNLSSGGVMIVIHNYLHSDVFLVMNVSWEQFDFPTLILGNVKHCHQGDDGQFVAGVEFVVSEVSQKLFSPARMHMLPPSLFEYDQQTRERFNRELISMYMKEKN